MAVAGFRGRVKDARRAVPDGSGDRVPLGARVFRWRASSCAGGGTPRPEVPTLMRLSAGLTARGDGEDCVSVPAAGPRVAPTAAAAVGYATDPDRRCRWRRRQIVSLLA